MKNQTKRYVRHLFSGWYSGQSFVEFALILPLLLILFTGMVEFGFALNRYLDLIDTAREVARFTSDDNPFPADPHSPTPLFSEAFYTDAAELTEYSLQQALQVELNQDTDDVVISVFQIDDGVVQSQRIPPVFEDNRDGMSFMNGGENGWQLHGNHSSRIPSSEVQERIDRMGDQIPPDSGIVLVEVFYDYHMVLGFPWITAFVNDPIRMHAYTFAPNPAAKPVD